MKYNNEKGFLSIILAITVLLTSAIAIYEYKKAQQFEEVFGGSFTQIRYGGTGTSTAPVDSNILIAQSSSVYAPGQLTAGSNIIISTSTGAITISTQSGNWLTSSGPSLYYENDIMMGTSSTSTAPFYFASTTGEITIRSTTTYEVNPESAVTPLSDNELTRKGYVDDALLSLFNDGLDGNATITTDTTLSADMYYDSLDINTDITLNTNGYKIYVKETLTNNGIINHKGNDAVTDVIGIGATSSSLRGGGDGGLGGSAGGLAGAGGGGGGIIIIVAKNIINNATITAGGGDGGTGTSGGGNDNGSNGNAIDASKGGNGGDGGDRIAGSGGGTGGNATSTVQDFKNIYVGLNDFDPVLNKGIGGGGGGGGGEQGSGNSGGGGGGGGGAVILYYFTLTESGIITVNGGLGAVGTGGGATGSNGGIGNVIKIDLND